MSVDHHRRRQVELSRSEYIFDYRSPNSRATTIRSTQSRMNCNSVERRKSFRPPLPAREFAKQRDKVKETTGSSKVLQKLTIREVPFSWFGFSAQ